MTSARELARCYDQYVFALWRGESDDVRRFAAWLKQRWDVGAPEEPESPPTAISAYGGAGAGLRWYDTPTHVLGYLPGVLHRCYIVPVDDAPPAFALKAVPPVASEAPASLPRIRRRRSGVA